MRRDFPRYSIDLIPGNLVHIYPVHGTADPPGLLNIRLAEFFLPPDECVQQQFLYLGSPAAAFSYTPELSRYLSHRNQDWHKAHGHGPYGIVGDFMGDCSPATHRRDPIYHNITVREALNLMAIRSLQVSSGQVPSTAPAYFKPKPISWKYRFRRESNADTGLGGVPLFQIF